MLGGNIGDRMDYLRRSKDLLQLRIGNLLAKSSIYESEPWGFDDEQWFLNQVAVVETNLAPLSLLEEIQQIEKMMGRERTNNAYQKRTIDIDILLYGNLAINTPELVVPHPRMCQRMFVLTPLAEIAPDMKHPVLNDSMTNLKDNCIDAKQVKLYYLINKK